MAFPQQSQRHRPAQTAQASGDDGDRVRHGFEPPVSAIFVRALDRRNGPITRTDALTRQNQKRPDPQIRAFSP
jgi:hypothetical protein